MVKVKGLTLLETMLAIAIGLLLLTAFMIVWVALSKSTHRELKVFEKHQDTIEAISYLREVFSRALYRPRCPNVEWLVYQGSLQESFIEKMIEGLDHPVVLYSFYEEVDGLKAHALKLLRGSNIVERVHFTPLVVVKSSQIMNAQDIKGVRDGYVLATDCRYYVVGKYRRDISGGLVLEEALINDVSNHLLDEHLVQYYKVNRDLLYVIHENGHDQLVHNFLDGSNHMRLYGINHLSVDFADELDRQLLLFRVAEEKFYVRLYNL